MNRLIKAVIAGVAAKKYGNSCLGGGCLGTVVVFLLVYFLLGRLNC